MWPTAGKGVALSPKWHHLAAVLLRKETKSLHNVTLHMPNNVAQLDEIQYFSHTDRMISSTNLSRVTDLVTSLTPVYSLKVRT